MRDNLETHSHYKAYRIIINNENADFLLRSYSSLLSETYEKEISEADLHYKHLQNPLGESVIVYALDQQGSLAAARALWRVASIETTAYQPCDTVTQEGHRGQGLFSYLTKVALSQIPDNSLVFNFPNNKSLHGYLKLGWSIYASNTRRFSFACAPPERTYECISELLPQRICGSFRDYLIWRYPKGKYHFSQEGENIIISNGFSSGFLVFKEVSSKKYNPIFSTGHCCRSSGFVEFFNFGVNVFFKSQSRTVFFANATTNSQRVKRFFGASDINIFMDTF